MTPWIVLDRDGVINIDSDNFIKNVEEWQPIPGSIDAIARLSRAGIRLVIATNQSGLGRGLFDLDDLEAMHAKMLALVEDAGGKIEGIFYCPHTPEANCNCRKPRAGLLEAIERELDCSLKGVPFVGDSERDLLAAIDKGCRPILVRTGKGSETEKKIATNTLLQSTEVFDDLAAFAAHILGTR